MASTHFLPVTNFNLLFHKMQEKKTAPINLPLKKPDASSYFFDWQAETVDAKNILQDLDYLYNAAACGYYSLDEKGNFIKINDIALKWWGYKRGEIVGKKNFAEIVTEKTRQKFVKEFEILKKKGRLENSIREIVCKDGSIMIVSMSSMAIYDEAGKFKMSRAVIIDVTEQKKTEQEFKDLYDKAPCGYYSATITGVITRMNQTALDWLGYTKDELVGKMSATDFIKVEPNFITELRKNFYDKIKTEGSVINLELVFRRKNGTEFPVSLNANAVSNEKGEITKSRISFWDITEKKQLENDLRKTSEQLYTANKEKDKFIGLASHDLQNPITAIQMSAELMQKSGNNLTSIQLKLLTNIRNSAERTNYIVTNILNLNRIESGIISEDWQTINLKSIIRDTTNRYQSFAAKKNITFKQVFDDNERWNILTEPNYLMQAFENLVSNALKFSQSDKTVTIELKKFKTQFYISVIDEGQGIKKEEMSRLFGKFQKLSAHPTGGEISTGLGLSIAKEYIDLLGGKIIYESEWGIGSVFTIVLPLNPK